MNTRTYSFDSDLSPCRVEILMNNEVVLPSSEVARLRFNVPMRVLNEHGSAGYNGALTLASVAALGKLGVPCFDAVTQTHPFDVRVTAYNPVTETNYRTTLLGCWFTSFENDSGKFSYVMREAWTAAPMQEADDDCVDRFVVTSKDEHDAVDPLGTYLGIADILVEDLEDLFAPGVLRMPAERRRTSDSKHTPETWKRLFAWLATAWTAGCRIGTLYLVRATDGSVALHLPLRWRISKEDFEALYNTLRGKEK